MNGAPGQPGMLMHVACTEDIGVPPLLSTQITLQGVWLPPRLAPCAIQLSRLLDIGARL